MADGLRRVTNRRADDRGAPPASRVEGDVSRRRGVPPNDRATMSTATVRVTATTVRETRASWKRSFQTRVTRTRPTMGGASRIAVVTRAGGNGGPNKKILRENEKDAWLSEMEREGGNPLKDPMALIGIGGIAVPFIILAVASVAGFIGQ